CRFSGLILTSVCCVCVCLLHACLLCVGPCRAAFPRFFYNPTNQSCSSFVYGGCESNRNNFLTLEECESSCSGVTGEMVSQQQRFSDSESRLSHLWSEVKVRFGAGSCQSFTYGGCKGNKNNYVDEESCMVTCSGKYCTCVCHCLVSPDPGPCRAAFPMFYYNPDSASCQSFIYGGCRGNENRYGSVEECMDHCSGDDKNKTKNIKTRLKKTRTGHKG
uniref:BPTI/Kunitz inhibitor domain-containing protein n=1 Tax=Amphiprion ocellaris TaxID=80972 RepID=A0A3Q1AGY5_AMPOC